MFSFDKVPPWQFTGTAGLALVWMSFRPSNSDCFWVDIRFCRAYWDLVGFGGTLSNLDEIQYLRRRAKQEHRLAEYADCPSAKQVHLELAAAYEARICVLEKQASTRKGMRWGI